MSFFIPHKFDVFALLYFRKKLLPGSILFSVDDDLKWDKVFKRGLSKFCGRLPLKNLKEADHIPPNFLKAAFYNIYLIHSRILCPKWQWVNFKTTAQSNVSNFSTENVEYNYLNVFRKLQCRGTANDIMTFKWVGKIWYIVYFSYLVIHRTALLTIYWFINNLLF